MPTNLIRTPLTTRDFLDPTLQQVNQKNLAMENEVDRLGGFQGPVSIKNDIALNGNAVTNSPSISVTQSVATGTINASTSKQVKCTWATPFGNSVTYVPVVSVLDPSTTTNGLSVHHIISVTPQAVVALIVNNDAGGAHSGTVYFTAKVQE